MQPAPDRNGRTDRPRFRQDLVAEPIEEQGARFIDVMDPDSGNLFRFYEVEYSLACGMDGERDVAGIVKWAQDELGMTPSPQEVRSVIATLGELGFIAGEGAEAQPELASGVVAHAVAPAVDPENEVELGLAGPSDRREPSAPVRREPSAPAVALGASGAAPARHAAEPVEDVALGNPGRAPARATPAPPVAESGDVSLDLADHIAVRRADVKEAVRASKVMSAVDVPQDLLDALEDKPVAKPVAKPEPARPAPVEARKAPEPRVEARPVAPVAEPKPAPRVEAPRVEAARPAPVPAPVIEAPRPAPVIEPVPAARPVAAKPAVELPKPPVVVEKPTQPTAPSGGTSKVLIVLLVLAVAGAVAFFVWKYVLQKPTADVESSTQPAPTPVQPAAPPPPPPPPAPTAKLAMELPAPDEIKLAAPGVVETILADKAVVKDGDVMVKLVGDKPVEAEITAATRELKSLQDKVDATTKKLDAAKAAGNKASETQAETELADRQKALGAKKDQLATKTADLEKFLIHAKGNGTFTPSAKQGQKLAADAVVATLQRDATPVATFKVTDPKPFTANASVELAIGKGEQHVTCTVAEVQADSVKVGCPADPALTDGADVTLKLPSTGGAEAPAVPVVTPPTTDTPATPPGGSAAAPEAAGSAAGGSAAGSADPASGSAAAPSK